MDLGGAVAATGELSRALLRVRWLPALERAALEEKLDHGVAHAPARPLGAWLSDLLPRRLAQALLASEEFDPERRLAEIGRRERSRLCDVLTATPLPVQGTRGFDFAEVTRGGVALAEVDPATLASRKVPGLFVVGELLDLDGPIGGFNFTSAFATGRSPPGGRSRRANRCEDSRAPVASGRSDRGRSRRCSCTPHSRRERVRSSSSPARTSPRARSRPSCARASIRTGTSRIRRADSRSRALGRRPLRRVRLGGARPRRRRHQRRPRRLRPRPRHGRDRARERLVLRRRGRRLEPARSPLGRRPIRRVRELGDDARSRRHVPVERRLRARSRSRRERRLRRGQRDDRARRRRVGRHASGLRRVEAGISADGTLVVFESESTNLVPGDTNGDPTSSSTTGSPERRRESASTRPASRGTGTASSRRSRPTARRSRS